MDYYSNPDEVNIMALYFYRINGIPKIEDQEDRNLLFKTLDIELTDVTENDSAIKTIALSKAVCTVEIKNLYALNKLQPGIYAAIEFPDEIFKYIKISSFELTYNPDSVEVILYFTVLE